MGSKAKSLACHLASLPDPRKIRGQRHVLLDILLIAILAELCGADSWEDIHREERFYISTLPMGQVETIGQGIRSHWGIENRLHWVLDVAFREDGNRTRKGNGPESSAILRHIVLNLLRQDPNPAGSIKFRRMQAAMSPDYRLAALLGFPQDSSGTLPV